jgi:hypothetical protein
MLKAITFLSYGYIIQFYDHEVEIRPTFQTFSSQTESTCTWMNFSIYLILPAALGPAVYSISNKNEYQKQKNNVSWV